MISETRTVSHTFNHIHRNSLEFTVLCHVKEGNNEIAQTYSKYVAD
jgi:hypothetical protein